MMRIQISSPFGQRVFERKMGVKIWIRKMSLVAFWYSQRELGSRSRSLFELSFERMKRRNTRRLQGFCSRDRSRHEHDSSNRSVQSLVARRKSETNGVYWLSLWEIESIKNIILSKLIGPSKTDTGTHTHTHTLFFFWLYPTVLVNLILLSFDINSERKNERKR